MTKGERREMKKLIDKEVLKSNIRDAFPDLRDRTLINSIINEQPTIDLIHCKDCINYHPFPDDEDNFGCCNVWGLKNDAVIPEDFCSFGEQKMEESNEL